MRTVLYNKFASVISYDFAVIYHNFTIILQKFIVISPNSTPKVVVIVVGGGGSLKFCIFPARPLPA